LIGWGNRVAAVFSWARALTFSKNRPHRTITYEHAQNELAEHPPSAGIGGFDRGAAREDLIVPGAFPGNRGRQMNASLLAVLNDAERLLVAQTERAELAALDEDAAIDLEARIRRARNKYVGQYR